MDITHTNAKLNQYLNRSHQGPSEVLWDLLSWWWWWWIGYLSMQYLLPSPPV